MEIQWTMRLANPKRVIDEVIQVSQAEVAEAESSWSIPIVRFAIFLHSSLFSGIQGSAIKAKILLRVPCLKWQLP